MEKLGVERALPSYTSPLELTRINQIQCNFWILRVKKWMQHARKTHIKEKKTLETLSIAIF